MTVDELRELIEDLPGDMVVLMPVGEEALVTVCYSQSDVQELEIDGEETREILLLVPCTCLNEELPIDLETNPN